MTSFNPLAKWLLFRCNNNEITGIMSLTMKRKLSRRSKQVPFTVNDVKDYLSNGPHCYICDGLVPGKGTHLLMGNAPYSKMALSTKIGQLMGDGFIVIMTTEDILCRRCSSLLIRLDKLEVDVEVVKKALIGYLKMKYNLYDEEQEIEGLEQDVSDMTSGDGIDYMDQYIYEDTCGVDLPYSRDEDENSYINEESEKIVSQSLDDPEKNAGYKCVSCQYKTTSYSFFVDHLKLHSDEVYFKCSNCDKEFYNHWEIQDHIKTTHNSRTSDSLHDAVDDVTATEQELTSYECNVCKFQSSDKTAFDSHISKHRERNHLFKCPICYQSFRSEDLLRQHMAAHEETFSDKSSLLDHFQDNNIPELPSAEEKPIAPNSSVNSEKQVLTACGEIKNETHLLSAVKMHDSDGVEELLKSSSVSVAEEKARNQNKMREAAQLEDVSKNQQKEMQQVSSDFQTTAFLLDSSIFDNDDDDIDNNEGCDTNDFLNDPSHFLEVFQSSTEKQDGSEVAYLHNSEASEADNTDITNNVLIKEDASSEKRRVYVCSECGLRLYSGNHMKRHLKTHIAVEKKMYECHICNKVLTTRSNLNRHLSNHENCPGAVTCKLCNEELTDRLHLKQHIEDHHTGPQHCSFCDMEFTSKKAFKEHELTHPERAVHQCDICHKRFLTQLRLRTHIENIHNSGEGNEDSKIYKCHICSKVLTTYHNLKRHVRNHEKCSGSITCSICNKELTDKLHLRQHIQEVHPETHQCAFCQKVFSNKKVCRSHELTHPERFVYKCDRCDEMFLNELKLEKHKTLLHRDPHCRYCEKEIKDATKLFNHERRHEMYKNKFPCQQCNKVFRTPSGLKYHMSVHTGQYAVYCEVCGKGLHSEIVLEEHKATHTKEIRYTCELCGRNFTSNSTYRMHRRWHDDPLPYKCKICDRKFKHTSILSVHMRRAHTGERPYKCPHCPYTFSVSSTLQKHIILHTKKYPFNCSLCSKGFTTRIKIAKHMAKVHNDPEMLNAKPTQCQYKMALKPSEMSADNEECILRFEDMPQLQLPEAKFEESVVEEHIVESQTIFLFQ